MEVSSESEARPGNLTAVNMEKSEQYSTPHVLNVAQQLSSNGMALTKEDFQQAPMSAIGTVSVINSDNVQFGNNTYFNGPVTIKQVIEFKNGIKNESYDKTEEEVQQHGSPVHNKKYDGRYCVQHKKRIALLLMLVIGGSIVLCAVLLATNNSTSLTHSNDTSGDDLVIAPFYLNMVSRTDWLAQPATLPLADLQHPVPWVIISHTAAESCFTQSECVLRVRLIQTFHIESRGWDDIGYNFLVGGDGSAYVGRGWNHEGAHTKGYNKYSIGISFIGTFNTEMPNKQQLDACERLIQLGVKLKKIDKDYKLFGHRQLRSTLSPGDRLFDIIRHWPHFVTNTSDVPLLSGNID